MHRERISAGTLDDADADSVARFFATLADPTRLRLLEFLCAGERTAGECAHHVHLPREQVVSHLQRLSDSGHVQPFSRYGRLSYRVTTTQTAHLMHLARTLSKEYAPAADCGSCINWEQ